MRKYYLLFAAVLLLIVDIRIPVYAYPAFEAFQTEAPASVSLVIGHVVGASLRIDLFSDAAGYLCLLVAAAWLSLGDRRFKRTFIWAAVSAAIYIYQQIMPFFLNGSLRFRTGYVFYFVSAVFQMIALFSAMYSVTGQLENTSNHSYNNVTVIVIMLCVGTGLVAAAVWFFDLIILSAVYYAAQLAAFGVAAWRIWKDRELLTGEGTV